MSKPPTHTNNHGSAVYSARTRIASLRGQGQFSFCKGHLHCKFYGEDSEGAPRPRPGATKAMESVASI